MHDHSNDDFVVKKNEKSDFNKEVLEKCKDVLQVVLT